MNRKGISVEYLIASIIAVAVLVVVLGYLFFGGGSNFADKLDNLIPTFNKSVEKVEGFESVRYDFKENKVQYYSGVKWMDFGKSGVVNLNDKLIKETDLSQAFLVWRTKSQIFSVSDKAIIHLSTFSNIFRKPTLDAEVYLDGKDTPSTTLILEYPYDEIQYNFPGEASQFPLNNIFSANGKDLLLSNSKSFSNYLLSNTFKLYDSNYCVKGYDDNYLVVDLSNPTLGEVCI